MVVVVVVVGWWWGGGGGGGVVVVVVVEVWCGDGDDDDNKDGVDTNQKKNKEDTYDATASTKIDPYTYFYPYKNCTIVSPLETISTSLWASLHHHFPLLSVFRHISCQFILLHILLGVVNPSPSRPPLLLFPGTTMPIIFLEILSSLLLMCPYQFLSFSVSGMLTFGIVCYSLV